MCVGTQAQEGEGMQYVVEGGEVMALDVLVMTCKLRPRPLLHSDIIHGHATQEMPSLKGPPSSHATAPVRGGGGADLAGMQLGAV